MSGPMLLKGRFYSNLRRLGAIGLVATGVTGVGVYFAFYQRRAKLLAEYKSTLTKENLEAIDRRVHKFAGLKFNDEFPDIPMYDLKSEEAKEKFAEFKEKLSPLVKRWQFENAELKTIDPDVTRSMAKVVMVKWRGKDDIISTPKAKREYKEALERYTDVRRKYFEKNAASFAPYRSASADELPDDPKVELLFRINKFLNEN